MPPRPKKIERDRAEEERLRAAIPGLRVRYFREVRGYSIQEAADMAEIPKSTWHAIEAGNTKHGSRLPALARVLEVASDYITEGRGSPDLKPVEVPAPAILVTQEPAPVPAAPEDDWPFREVSRDRIDQMTRSELRLVDLELREIVERIEADRHSRPSEPRP